MQVKRLPLGEAAGHLLLHNVVDADGRRLLRKGRRLDEDALRTLADLGWDAVEVAALAPEDVWEDDAAHTLAAALETPELSFSAGVGGRVNVQSVVHGLLYVDEARLFALNQIPGITLGTLAQHTIVKPERGENRIATLKIIPYAIPQASLDRAIDLAGHSPPLLNVRPLSPQRLILLITGDEAAHVRLRRQFEPPTQERLLRLNSELSRVHCVAQDEATLAHAVAELLPQADGLILAGQTSIMDMDDLPLRALRRAGATVTVHGAPVDPGNLLALAYAQGKPILCAPGCARSPARNVMDLILPRLLVGERLTQADVARMGLGGVLSGA
jgi:hypothetical protein